MKTAPSARPRSAGLENCHIEGTVVRKAMMLVLVMVAACKNDPLRDDMKVFCRAADVTNSKQLVDIGPYVAERVKTKEMLDVFVLLKGGTVTITDVELRFHELVAKAGLAECATLDILEGKRTLQPAK